MAAVGSSTRRVEYLANPKGLPQEYFEDRKSVYWVDRLPPMPAEGCTTEFITTPRVNQLAFPKRDYCDSYDRSHDELPAVRRSALSGTASARVEQLAEHKPLYAGFQPERPVETRVGPGPQKAVATPRLEALACSKSWHKHPVPIAPLGSIHSPITDIPPAAMTASATPRVEALAEAKKIPDEYKMQKPVQWPVKEAVINASASTRLQQLARPKSSKAIGGDYDPYVVPLAAIRARPTARVEELAAPIPRKCRTKKVV